MQDKARRRDDAVAAFLLHSRQPGEELVGHVLAEPCLAEPLARNRQRLLALERAESAFCVDGVVRELECGDRRVVDLSQIVIEPRDLEPVGIGRDHAPRGEIIERRAPQHRLLATRVHGDVAADARGVRRRGIDREHEPSGFRRIHHSFGDHARTGVDRRRRLSAAGKSDALDGGQALELFRIDHRRAPVERYRAAGVTRAAAARNNGEPELDASAH